MPGAQCTRSLACECETKHTSVVTTGPPESPGIPARNGFNGLFRALPGERIRLVTVISGLRFCQTRSGPTSLRKFSTSNGCQDHTALPYASEASVVRTPFIAHEVHLALRSRCVPDAAASTASRPASMTMANAPLWDGTVSDILLIWVSGEAKFFCKGGWTGFTDLPAGQNQ
jgi:hypothetical protein